MRFPPPLRMSMPASVAAAWPDTTIAWRPKTGARGLRHSGPLAIVICSLVNSRADDHVAPLGHVGAYAIAKRLRRPRLRLDALLGQGGSDAGIIERGRDL